MARDVARVEPGIHTRPWNPALSLAPAPGDTATVEGDGLIGVDQYLVAVADDQDRNTFTD